MILSLNCHCCWLTTRPQRKLQKYPWVTPVPPNYHQKRGEPGEQEHF